MELKYTSTQVRQYSLSTFFVVFMVFLQTNLYAQEYSISDKKAIKFFELAQSYYQHSNFIAAVDELNKAIERVPEFIEAYTLLGYVNLDLNRVSLAKKNFEKAVHLNPDFIPNNLYFLGELELKDGEYEKAKKHLSRYLQSNPQDQRLSERTKRGINTAEFAIDQIKHPIEFSPENLGPEINTEYAEYFPCITVDESMLLFTRRLPFPEAPQGFNEDFFVSYRKNETWSTAQNMARPINTKNNEGAPSLSADGQILFFTACELYGDYGGNRKGFGSCDVFYTLKNGTTWIEPMNLGNSINTGHWETQPSFSSDGTTLYFIRGKRNRTGNRTGDIYVSYLSNEGMWSEPKILPSNINTKGNEESVFIHPDGKTLYFSSDGHLGMGGLDIYKTVKQVDGSWSDPINLGYPLNTHKNENSLLVAANGQEAYFASDREEGFGDLDLYKFKLNKSIQPTPVTYFSGKIYDEETKENLGAKFELIDLETEKLIVESYSNSKTGKFLVSLPFGKEYALNVSKKGYLFHSENFELKSKTDNEAVVKNVGLFPLKAGKSVVLKNIFFETGKYDLKPTSKVELEKLIAFLNANPSVKIEISGHTDNVGSKESNQILSENRAKSVSLYLVKNGILETRITSKGYGSSSPIADNTSPEGRAKNRRTEFKVLKID